MVNRGFRVARPIRDGPYRRVRLQTRLRSKPQRSPPSRHSLRSADLQPELRRERFGPGVKGAQVHQVREGARLVVRSRSVVDLLKQAQCLAEVVHRRADKRLDWRRGGKCGLSFVLGSNKQNVVAQRRCPFLRGRRDRSRVRLHRRDRPRADDLASEHPAVHVNPWPTLRLSLSRNPPSCPAVTGTAA